VAPRSGAEQGMTPHCKARKPSERHRDRARDGSAKPHVGTGRLSHESSARRHEVPPCTDISAPNARGISPFPIVQGHRRRPASSSFAIDGRKDGQFAIFRATTVTSSS
jgi:hypothetical protein